MAGKDVEYKRGAVENASVEFFLEVAELGRGEVVVNHHNINTQRIDVFLYFLEFPGADVGAGVGTLEFLNHFLHRDSTGGSEQELKLVEVFLSATDGLV